MGDSVRVLQLYDGHEKVYDGKGSVPGVVWNIAREMAASGHDMTVLERQWEGLPQTAKHDGVAIHRLDLSTGTNEPWERVPYEVISEPLEMTRLVGDRVNFALQALRYLRAMEFDVVHVHLPFTANVLVTVAPRLRERLVYTAHMGELRLDALTDDPSERSIAENGRIDTPQVLQLFSPDIYLARRSASTTVMNPTICESFVEKGAPSDRIQFVPNGVDIDRFDPDDREIEAVTSRYKLGDQPVVLFLGTIMPRKGVTELMRAAGTVVSERGVNDVEFVLAGNPDLDQDYTDEVRSTIQQEGIEDSVTFTGFVDNDEIPGLYGRADLFVLPSLEEGFPLTPLEAMSARTPVIASRVGGIPRQFDDGEEGRLLEPSDEEALADAMEELLTDAERREAMSQAAADRAREFAWKRVADQFDSIYRGVAE